MAATDRYRALAESRPIVGFFCEFRCGRRRRRPILQYRRNSRSPSVFAPLCCLLTSEIIKVPEETQLQVILVRAND